MATLVAGGGGAAPTAVATTTGSTDPPSSSPHSPSTDSTNSIHSSRGSSTSPTTTTANRGATQEAAVFSSPCKMNNSSHNLPKPERVTSEQEIVDFLLEHFVATEPILAALQISESAKDELTLLLRDIVRDCVTCSSSCGIRDEEGQLMGICLASKALSFEKQLDRLWMYKFEDERMRTAVEFLKYVFNRVDVVFHCEERNISKPIFVALVCSRPADTHRGVARAVLDHCLQVATDERNDGALMLCSGERAVQLAGHSFKETLCKIRYSDYRGEYRSPPIQPTHGNHTLHVLLAKLKP